MSINCVKKEKINIVNSNIWRYNMKFIKGLVIGGLITTGVLMMCSDNDMNTKKIAKKGKRWAKKMGMM